MTGYHISIGYNGQYKKPFGVGVPMWDRLKENARRIADDTEALVKEARRLGAPEKCDGGCCTLQMHAESYANPFEPGHGNPVVIVDEPENQQIMQMASTDDAIKFHVRRAYARLLIEAMHRDEIEVCLTVA